MRRAIPCLLVLLLSLGCRPSVTRIVDGNLVSGRPISAEAYAMYLEARLLETAGDRPGASCSYRRVLELDPQAVEATVRLAGLTCAVDAAAANSLFEQAARLEPQSEVLWSTRADCALLARQFQDAETFARRAWELSPTDFDTNRRLIEALLGLGRAEEAHRLALGLIALTPRDPRVARLLLDAAPLSALTEEWALPTEADRWLRSNRPSLTLLESTKLSPRTQQLLTAHLESRLVHALATADDPSAQRLARALGRTTVELGRLALSRGNPRLALSLLSAAHDLAPERTDLIVEALDAADLERDEPSFARLVAELPAATSPLSDATRTRLWRILSRRLGTETSNLTTQP